MDYKQELQRLILVKQEKLKLKDGFLAEKEEEREEARRIQRNSRPPGGSYMPIDSTPSQRLEYERNLIIEAQKEEIQKQTELLLEREARKKDEEYFESKIEEVDDKIISIIRHCYDNIAHMSDTIEKLSNILDLGLIIKQNNIYESYFSGRENRIAISDIDAKLRREFEKTFSEWEDKIISDSILFLRSDIDDAIMISDSLLKLTRLYKIKIILNSNPLNILINKSISFTEIDAVLPRSSKYLLDIRYKIKNLPLPDNFLSKARNNNYNRDLLDKVQRELTSVAALFENKLIYETDKLLRLDIDDSLRICDNKDRLIRIYSIKIIIDRNTLADIIFKYAGSMDYLPKLSSKLSPIGKSFKENKIPENLFERLRDKRCYSEIMNDVGKKLGDAVNAVETEIIDSSNSLIKADLAMIYDSPNIERLIGLNNVERLLTDNSISSLMYGEDDYRKILPKTFDELSRIGKLFKGSNIPENIFEKLGARHFFSDILADIGPKLADTVNAAENEIIDSSNSLIKADLTVIYDSPNIDRLIGLHNAKRILSDNTISSLLFDEEDYRNILPKTFCKLDTIGKSFKENKIPGNKFERLRDHGFFSGIIEEIGPKLTDTVNAVETEINDSSNSLIKADLAVIYDSPSIDRLIGLNNVEKLLTDNSISSLMYDNNDYKNLLPKTFSKLNPIGKLFRENKIPDNMFESFGNRCCFSAILADIGTRLADTLNAAETEIINSSSSLIKLDIDDIFKTADKVNKLISVIKIKDLLLRNTISSFIFHDDEYKSYFLKLFDYLNNLKNKFSTNKITDSYFHRINEKIYFDNIIDDLKKAEVSFIKDNKKEFQDMLDVKLIDLSIFKLNIDLLKYKCNAGIPLYNFILLMVFLIVELSYMCYSDNFAAIVLSLLTFFIIFNIILLLRAINSFFIIPKILVASQIGDLSRK